MSTKQKQNASQKVENNEEIIQVSDKMNIHAIHDLYGIGYDELESK